MNTEQKPKPIKQLAKNRKAFHEYHIAERYEAGLVLRGTEVKAIRAGKMTISESWVSIDANQEAYLMQANVSPYDHGNIYNHTPERPRKLLLKKKQLRELVEVSQQKGMTIIPLQVYLKGNNIKVEIAVARGKQAHDKRETQKAREADREIARALRGRH